MLHAPAVWLSRRNLASAASASPSGTTEIDSNMSSDWPNMALSGCGCFSATRPTLPSTAVETGISLIDGKIKSNWTHTLDHHEHHLTTPHPRQVHDGPAATSSQTPEKGTVTRPTTWARTQPSPHSPPSLDQQPQSFKSMEIFLSCISIICVLELATERLQRNGRHLYMLCARAWYVCHSLIPVR